MNGMKNAAEASRVPSLIQLFWEANYYHTRDASTAFSMTLLFWSNGSGAPRHHGAQQGGQLVVELLEALDVAQDFEHFGIFQRVAQLFEALVELALNVHLVEAQHGIVAGQLGQVYFVEDVDFLGAPVGADFVALGGQVGDELADVLALVLGQQAGIGEAAGQELLPADFPHFGVERLP